MIRVWLRNLAIRWRKLRCRWSRHKWQENENITKRICLRCRRVEWLHYKRFPMIGEAQRSWRYMYYDYRN